VPIAYHFNIPGFEHNIQDIGTIVENNGQLRISVAGFTRSGLPVVYKAWHGYVLGLSNSSTMENSYHFDTDDEKYRHYKIGYYDGKEYTGGSYQGEIQSTYSTGALFSSPLISTNICNPPITSDTPSDEIIHFSSFNLLPWNRKSNPYFYESFEDDMDDEKNCGILKGGKYPKSVMVPSEKEGEITTFYDRITVKEVPANTSYQIYNTIGQLVQEGTTNSDISTTKLGKGVYILRLESGKTFKFVK